MGHASSRMLDVYQHGLPTLWEAHFNVYCHVCRKGLISYRALSVPLFLFAKHPISHLECMVGTRRLELLTSTVSR